MNVREWLAALGLERYADAFVQNDIDASVLPTLTDADLATLGVGSLGHRKRILRAIEGDTVEPPPPAPSASARSTRTRASSRPRHTVLERAGTSSAATAAEPRAVLDAALAPSLLEALRGRGYEIVGRIGQGGMGEVFRAEQTSVGRDVALKVLRGYSDAADRTRFSREARAIAALQHPHAVRLFDFVVADDGSSCIVMEYVQGTSLWSLMQAEGPLPFTRIVPIIAQICDALSEAHAKGIVHRDLKPANVILQEAEGYRDFAKVLDFGLATWTTPDGVEQSRLTQTGTVHGTPRYLSPEQILGSAVGPRSDLYSLGVVLYEALAGRAPFVGELDAALMFRHLKEPAPPLPPGADRPPALDRILDRLLAKSPAARPLSALTLRRELVALMPAASGRSSIAPSPVSGRVPERRHVVVVDVGFFERGRAPVSAESAHDLARRCQGLVDAIALRYGATENARTRGSVQLVFGAPIARQDDARRALEAAMELRATLPSLDAAAIVVRIGVADGAAVTGALREGVDSRYVVSGAPVAEAERLRDDAGPGEIRVARTLSARELPGATFTALGADARLDELRRAARADDARAPFVGRERELDVVRRLLDGVVSEGRGTALVVVGEAGIGKSRLVDQLAQLARERGMRALRGLLYDVDVAEGEDALHQLVSELLALPEDLPSRTAAVERRLPPSALRADEWPFLYHFLGTELPGPMQRVYDAMDPVARLSGYRDMLTSLFSYEAAAQPVVVVVEDVHWADASTLGVIESLAGTMHAQPLVLVLTSRAEDEARWKHILEQQRVVRIDLQPLAEADAKALAALLLPIGVAPAAVVARAGGHPLLLTELARSGETLEEDPSLPFSVQGLVHARVDRLPDDDRAAMHVASALGPRFKLAHLRSLLGQPDYVPRLLEEHRLLLREADGGYAFAHALVRDAVYDSLVEDRRRALHQRAAECLVGDLGLVAMHLDRAGSPRAASAYLAAARADIARHELREAEVRLGRGLALATTDAERQSLHATLGGVLVALGDSARALEAYEHARRLATGHDAIHAAELGLASALRDANRYEDALLALSRADEAGERATLEGQPVSGAHASYLRGAIEFARGKVDASSAAHERALALATASGATELRASALSGIADAHYGAGRLVSAARLLEECILVARAEGLLGVESVNLPMLAIMSVFLNQNARAKALAREAESLARTLGRRRAEALACGARCLSALARGEFEEACLAAVPGFELTRKLGSVVYEETLYYYQARGQIGVGDLAAARVSCDAGLALCAAHGAHFVGAALLATRARLEPSAVERARLLSEGEAVLARGTLSFNRFWFFENAIEVHLAHGDAQKARAYAEQLLRTAEPIPWVERTVERALALADHVEGRRDEATRARLATALDGCRAAELGGAIVALEHALEAVP